MLISKSQFSFPMSWYAGAHLGQNFLMKKHSSFSINILYHDLIRENAIRLGRGNDIFAHMVILVTATQELEARVMLLKLI